ncbi:MAG: hypothetical protein A2051_05610 [Desulfovibrionales bacterium GWA2_65_9]|nr:MAG: hypothetical protein A2051_05610 [Desulfovibrionales bacterium GWA2_65_9]
MGNDWIQHIGDDQLIDGLPKHMEAVAGDGKNTYWEIVPSKNACATCQTMRGMRFEKNPVPVHPNCACEVIRVPPPERQPRVVESGRLQGFGDNETHRFEAGQKITITFLNLGPFPAGVYMRVDQAEEKLSGKLVPGLPESFEFSKFGDTPLAWELFLLYQGLDGSTIEYKVRG